MVSTTNNNQCRGQSSTTIMMGKKVLLAALTIASASSLIATEAFQPPTMSASFGTSSSRADSTKLKYAVYERDQATTTTANAKSIELKKPKKVHQIEDDKNRDGRRQPRLHCREPRQRARLLAARPPEPRTRYNFEIEQPRR